MILMPSSTRSSSCLPPHGRRLQAYLMMESGRMRKTQSRVSRQAENDRGQYGASCGIVQRLDGPGSEAQNLQPADDHQSGDRANTQRTNLDSQQGQALPVYSCRSSRGEISDTVDPHF